MNPFTAWLAGSVFGVGLIVSGMTEPHKVLGFLDITGRWDPSLAFVMAGAVSVTALAFAFARRRRATPSAQPQGRIDRRLLLGALIFGIGWGLAGICPGPAVVLVGSGSGDGLIFAAGMLGGMLLFNHLTKRSTPSV